MNWVIWYMIIGGLVYDYRYFEEVLFGRPIILA